MGSPSFQKVAIAAIFLILVLCGRGQAEQHYTVKRGDSLYDISRRFAVSLEALKKANGLKKDNLRVKQVLVIPAQKKERGERRGGTI